MPRTGLRDIVARQGFASGVLAVKAKWTDKGMDAAKRASAVVAVANQALGRYKVPPVVPRLSPQANEYCAEFQHEHWRVDLDRRGFEGKTPPSLRHLAELVDSVYHECRHAEQWYLVARYCAANGILPEKVAQRGHLKLEIARKASQAPLNEGSADTEFAFRLTSCLMTKAGTDRIVQTQRDLDVLTGEVTATKKEKEEARERLEKLGYIKPNATDEQIRRAAHRAYMYQFAETDAWDTGRLARETFLHIACRQPPPVPVKKT